MTESSPPPAASPARLLGLCASLRADSLNAHLLHVAAGMLPAGLHMDIFDELDQVPHYNADLDTGSPRRVDPSVGPDAGPPAVVRLRQAIRGADGLIIATPEYNHAIPGVLKNALDWASRPTTDLPLTGKAIIVLVATRGRVLGHRGLADTVRVLTGFANIVVPGPEIVVNSAHEHLVTSPDGTVALTDPHAVDAIRKQLLVLDHLIASGAARSLGEAMRRHVPSRWW